VAFVADCPFATHREHHPVMSVGYYGLIERARIPVWQKRAETRHF